MWLNVTDPSRSPIDQFVFVCNEIITKTKEADRDGMAFPGHILHLVDLLKRLSEQLGIQAPLVHAVDVSTGNEFNSWQVVQSPLYKASCSFGPPHLLTGAHYEKLRREIRVALESWIRYVQGPLFTPPNANTTKLFPQGIPDNPNIVDLVVRLDAGAGGKKSQQQIAMEMTDGNKKLADSLLSQIRRLRREGKVNL